jgi:hypothetical protein
MRPPLPLALVSLLTLILPKASADPASIPFSDCFDEPESVGQKLDVDTVYAQVLQNEEWGRYLNLTVVGTSRQDILGMSNTSTSLCESASRVHSSLVEDLTFLFSNAVYNDLCAYSECVDQ